MGDLSKDFSKSEFTCRCCGEVTVSAVLMAALQQLRDLAGRPISILSGYRCPDHNRKVGGTRFSQHLLGTAADLVIPGLTPREVYDLAVQVPAFRDGGIGLYPKEMFIHLDVRPTGPKRWARIEGRYVDIEEALTT